jgi:hypothetical protein
MKPKDYIPEKFGECYYKFLIEIKPCGCCSKPMARMPNWNSPFPHSLDINFNHQRNLAGIELCSNRQIASGKEICVKCWSDGKETCECYLCKNIRPSNNVVKSFGYGGFNVKYLCKFCYDSVSAKKWDETCEKLEDEHKYDYNV